MNYYISDTHFGHMTIARLVRQMKWTKLSLTDGMM